MADTMENAFMRDIIEHPDDDTPRLVYADWLEENGNPDRAEFIRVQCELEQISADDERYAELKKREQDFLNGYQKPQDVDVFFRRGFEHRISMCRSAFRANAKKLLGILTIEELEIVNPYPDSISLPPQTPRSERDIADDHYEGEAGQSLAMILRSRSIDRLNRLMLMNYWGAENVPILLRRERPLASMKILEIRGAVLDAIEARRLFCKEAHRILPQLHQLSLQDNLIGSNETPGADLSWVQAMARARHHPHLTNLNLRQNRVTQRDANEMRFFLRKGLRIDLSDQEASPIDHFPVANGELSHSPTV